MRTTGPEVSRRHEMEVGWVLVANMNFVLFTRIGQVETARDIVIYDIVEDPGQEKARSGATRDIASHQLPPTKSY
ncbi:hypothetical protein ALC60_00247 [Trachymyrmex zeteki]|uniref:Uncharacterized protein n=1 Tax=Mycetomoellerius zeteki TaxID=64791 RepID=A0A151XJN0_9HYME|nr:hypothetical protein ALC60_00247 [Trachymyrmex zeteki]